MDNIKEKIPVIGVGIAAVALAGYLCYKSFGNKADGTSGSQAPIPEVIKQLLPDFHWMSESLTQEEKAKKLEEWMQQQIESLLEESQGQLKAPSMQLSRKDFVKVLNMVRQSFEIHACEQKKRLQTDRAALLTSDEKAYFELVVQ